MRLDVSWPTSVGRAELRHWADLDRVVSAARKRGLGLLPVIAYTPPWAAAAGCSGQSCAPRDPARFADFAKLAVARYQGQGVHTWEVWNEENMSRSWKPAPDAPAYATLLKAPPAPRSAPPTPTLT